MSPSKVHPSSSKPSPVNLQLKFMETSVMPALCRHKLAWPFLKPVDVIALNIPDYFQIIEHPGMDFSTIQERLKHKFYWELAECLMDIELVFDNCFKYNRRDDDISKMALKLKKYLQTLMKKMPMAAGSQKKPEKNTGVELRKINSKNRRVHGKEVSFLLKFCF